MKLRFACALMCFALCACANAPAGAPGPPLAETPDCAACPPCPEPVASLASAFSAYSDGLLVGVREKLRLMAENPLVQSGDFEKARPVLAGFEKRNSFLAAFYCMPDGSYYRPETGLTGKSLADRGYYRLLRDGQEVFCSLVMGKVTGLPTAVVAVPVMKKGKMVAAVLASVSLRALNSMAASALALPEDMFFFALAPGGTTTLNHWPEYIFQDPRRLHNPSLKAAMETILEKKQGEICYVFAGHPRKVRFLSGPDTGWRYAVGVVEAQLQ